MQHCLPSDNVNKKLACRSMKIRLLAGFCGLVAAIPFWSGSAVAFDFVEASCPSGSIPARDGVTNALLGCLRVGIFADFEPVFSPTFPSVTSNPQDVPVPPIVDPGSDLGADNSEDSHGQPKCGNPIDMSSGNKYQRDVDFVGEGTLPLEIVRHYNSLSAANTSALFGRQQSNFSERLSDYEETGSGASITRTIVIHNGTGLRIALSQTGMGRWQRESGKTEFLSRGPNGYWYFIDGAVLKVFLPSGELHSITNEFGESHTYEYNASDRLVEIRHSSGRRLAIGYDSQGRIFRILDPANKAYDYTYDSLGNLKTVTYPAGVDGIRPVRTFGYQYGNSLHYIRDEENLIYARYTYEQAGVAKRSYHGEFDENVELVTRYQAPGSNVVVMNNALGKRTDFVFEEVAGKKRVTRVNGHQKGTCLAANRYHYYDSRGYKRMEIDWENNITDYVYDEFGHLRSMTRGRVMGPPATILPRTTTYDWNNALDKPTRVTTPLLETIYEYEDSGLPKTISMRNLSQYGIPDQTRTIDFTYSFHPSGIRKSTTIDGPRTDVTTMNYDASGQLSSVQNALGHVTTYSNYDAYGRVGRITFPSGLVRELTYHPRGWLLTSRIHVDGQWRTTSYDYNKIGMVTKVTRPDGSSLDFEYDTARRLIKLIDSNDHAMTYMFDKASNITSETIAELVTTVTYELDWFSGIPVLVEILNTEEIAVRTESFEYDALSRLNKIITGVGDTREYKYNKNNLLTESYDGKGANDRNFYSSLNEVYYRYTRENGGITPGYDMNGQLKSMRDAVGNRTNYQRDGFGQVWQVDSPATGITQYVYDTAGNLTSMTDARGVTTTRTYDALNRQLTSQAGSDTVETFQYDTGRQGMLYRVTDSAGTHTFTHNQAGELRQKTTTFAGQTLTTAYTYDTSGRVDKLTYPSGWQADYDYDAVGKVSRIRMLRSGFATRTVVDNVEYRPMGPLASLTFGNGEMRTVTRDLSYRPTLIASGNHIYKGYDYDANSNITSIDDQLVNANDRTLDYDIMDRLDYSNGPAGLWEYDYNKNGDRLWSREGGAQVTYNYSSTKLTSRTGGGLSETRTYSANGQTESIGNREFAYNGNNRFYEYRENGTLRSAYRYDAFGARGYKSIGSDNYWFVYSGPSLLHERRNTQLRDYVYLNGEVVGMMYNNTLYYVHGDHLGRPEVITNSAQTKVWQAANDDFYNTPVIDNIGAFNIGFPGQYFDVESGMYYNYFRTYDPSTGRYLESDPIGNAGGLNTYGYGLQNPLSYTDALGLTVSCYYDSRTGRLVCTDDTTGQKSVDEVCYSGAPNAVNDPAQQDVPNVGPVPIGDYLIGTGVNNRGTGPQSLPMTPSPNNTQRFPTTRDPNSFLIHGDNPQQNQTASEGCIICSRATRDTIDAAGGGTVRVRAPAPPPRQAPADSPHRMPRG